MNDLIDDRWIVFSRTIGDNDWGIVIWYRYPSDLGH